MHQAALRVVAGGGGGGAGGGVFAKGACVRFTHAAASFTNVPKTKEDKAAFARWLRRDHLLRAHTPEARLALVVNTASVRACQERFGMTPVASHLVGRCMTMASLLTSFLKGEERVTVEAQGNGPIESVYAEAVTVGELRGYVANPTVELSASQGLGAALGHGQFVVRRIVYNERAPIVSMVALQEGDICSEAQHFFEQSEQIKTKVLLHTEVDQSGVVTFSAGYLSQLISGTSPALEQQWEQRNAGLEGHSLRSLLRESKNDTQQALVSLAGDQVAFGSFQRTPVDFFCRCTKASVVKLLLTLSANDVQSLRDNDQRDLTCRFCNKKYTLSDSDLGAIVEHLQQAPHQRRSSQ